MTIYSLRIFWQLIQATHPLLTSRIFWGKVNYEWIEVYSQPCLFIAIVVELLWGAVLDPSTNIINYFNGYDIYKLVNYFLFFITKKIRQILSTFLCISSKESLLMCKYNTLNITFINCLKRWLTVWQSATSVNYQV